MWLHFTILHYDSYKWLLSKRESECINPLCQSKTIWLNNVCKSVLRAGQLGLGGGQSSQPRSCERDVVVLETACPTLFAYISRCEGKDDSLRWLCAVIQIGLRFLLLSVTIGPFPSLWILGWSLCVKLNFRGQIRVPHHSTSSLSLRRL